MFTTSGPLSNCPLSESEDPVELALEFSLLEFSWLSKDASEFALLSKNTSEFASLEFAWSKSSNRWTVTGYEEMTGPPPFGEKIGWAINQTGAGPFVNVIQLGPVHMKNEYTGQA